ncbi:MAG: dUTP diphosphatase [Candidatus Cloacimonetes bacterium]|nr:dUTP diphosphatase [Candidatus Cloacimonadota bacterium]
MIKVIIQKLTPHARTPERMTSLAAGYDLYSSNAEIIEIPPASMKVIPTGIALSLPAGYEAQIRPRSGLASQYQIGILNSPGTIDADYRGEIKVILFNFGERIFTVKPYSRIAQMIFTRHETIEFEERIKLDQTERDKGGFGHTDQDKA